MITEKSKLALEFEKLLNEIEQTGREIYYAMSFLEEDNPAMANLKAALKCLGIEKPGDVGLSDSVIGRNHHDNI